MPIIYFLGVGLIQVDCVNLIDYSGFTLLRSTVTVRLENVHERAYAGLG